MVLGSESCRRYLGHEGRVLVDRVNAVIKEVQEISLLPFALGEDTRRCGLCGSRPLPGTESALFLDSPASRTVINTHYLFFFKKGKNVVWMNEVIQ
jgi:hypothetical protein